MKMLLATLCMGLLIPALIAHATVWNVDVADFQFTPAALTILQGDTVIWTNTNGVHSVRPDCPPQLFGNDPASSPWTYQFIFNVPIGGYPYHCEVHPDMMRGIVNVQQRGTWHVTVQNFSFTPADITITHGDTVVWNNISGFHSVHHNATPSVFGTPAASAPWTYQFIFSSVADSTYHYLCEVHPTLMHGTVTVTAPSILPTPAGLVIYPSDAAHVQLQWNSVCGAAGYAVFRSTDAALPIFPDSIGMTTDTTMTDPVSSTKEFYLVRTIQ